MALHDAQFTGEGWFDPYSPPRAGGWFDNELLEVGGAAVIVMTADTGVYSIVGSAAHGLITTPLATGVYLITGSTADLLKSIVLLAESGAYTITGSAATALLVMPAATGAYLVTGSAVAFILSLPLAAGSYAVVGQVINCSITTPLATGLYVYTGQDAALLKTFLMVAESGTYLIAGSDAELTDDQVAAAVTSIEQGKWREFHPYWQHSKLRRR